MLEIHKGPQGDLMAVDPATYIQGRIRMGHYSLHDVNMVTKFNLIYRLMEYMDKVSKIYQIRIEE